MPVMFGKNLNSPSPTSSDPQPQTRRSWGLGLLGACVGGAAWLTGCSSKPKAGRKQGGKAATPAPAAGAQGSLQLPPKGREALLARTLMVVNTPYTYGGNTPEGGFDCSGLVQYAVSGVTQQALPRSTAQWARASRRISSGGLQRGDFVFFNTTGKPYSHMGIYVGNGQFVHAPSSGGQVKKVRMDNPYFAKRFMEARSIFR